jgi:hypothetical protein
MEADHFLRRHLGGAVSPPPPKRRRVSSSLVTSAQTPTVTHSVLPSPAAIEAGKAKIDDHLTYFTSLYEEILKRRAGQVPPHLPLPDFRALYNLHGESPSGHNFVIHQHDHPRAGLHYDLRLQINATSSCSWSIPYGLPGNPWERRLGRRQAIETRIHCLWNHLTEAASRLTGSMLIWDFGRYEVLPWEEEQEEKTTDEERDGSSDVSGSEADELGDENARTQPRLLEQAFRRGKIRLRLHGAHLPAGYTVSLRLSKDKGPAAQATKSKASPSTNHQLKKMSKKEPKELSSLAGLNMQAFNEDDFATFMNAANEAIKAANAYPDASNTIGSSKSAG